MIILSRVLFGFSSIGTPQWWAESSIRLLLLMLGAMYFLSFQFRRELLSIFVSSSTYLVICLFVVILSLLFYLLPLSQGYSSLVPIFSIILGLQVLFMPLLTMKMVSEEWQQGTIELILTSSVSLWEVVLAKFAACLVFYFVMLLPLLVYGGLLIWVGNLDYGATLSGVIGLVLIGFIYGAVGIFASTIGRNQIAAAMLAMVILFLMFFLGDQSLFRHSVWRWFSFVPHLMPILDDGLVSLEGVVTILAQTTVFLFLARMMLAGCDPLAGIGAGQAEKSLKTRGLLLALSVESALLGYACNDIQRTSIFLLFTDKWNSSNGHWPLFSFLCFTIAVASGAITLYGFFRSNRINAVWFSLRRGALSNSVLSLVVMAFFLVNVCLLARNSGFRADFTDMKLNTLNNISRDTLARLQQPLTFQVFFTEENRYGGVDLLEQTRALLEEFKAESQWVNAEFIDPDRDLARANAVASSQGLEFSRLSAVMVMSYGERKSLIPWEYMAPEQTNELGRKVRVFMGETVIISVMNRILDPRQKIVYFSEGKGEYDMFDRDLSSRKGGTFLYDLKISGFETRRLMLGRDRIPDDCDLLVLAGPLLPFRPDDITALTLFLDRGGSLFLLVDPITGVGDRLMLEPIMKRRGVVLQDDTLFLPDTSVNRNQGLIVAVGNEKHEITQAGNQLRVQLINARSLAIRKADDHLPGWEATYLLKTGTDVVSLPNQYFQGATNKVAINTEKGRFGCAVALSGPNKSRIVVIGDADIIGNCAIDQEYNSAFLRSCVLWLLKCDYAVDIQPREDEARSVIMTGVQRRVTFWVVLVVVPQFFVLIGLMVWWCRRS